MQMAPRGYGQPGEKVGLLASNTFTLYNPCWHVAGGIYTEALKALHS